MFRGNGITGGRFADRCRHLIITYNTSIQVYSTEDSLLVRRIALPVTGTDDTTEFVATHIVSSVLSTCDADYLWVACSDGRIWHINWTSGAGVDTPFRIEAKKVLDVAVDAVEIGGKSEDVLLVLKRLTKSSAQIVAYNTKALSTGIGKLLHTYDESPQLLRSAAEGRLIVAAAKETLHIGALKAKKLASLDDLTYRFHCFDVPDIVTCLDIRPTLRTTKKGGLELQSVDLAVGCARGAIHVYHDVLSKLPGEGSASSRAGIIQPKKYHWHRRAVHSVKWSQDGQYLTLASVSPRCDNSTNRQQGATSSLAVTRLFWFSGKLIPGDWTFYPIFPRPLRTSSCLPGGPHTPFTWMTTRQ
jgi:NET1-associated nuclear protein 1 (U3 small nucleolar RNA-associated protein 17)